MQTAAKLVLEPIFEADFDPSAYGYRPKRGAMNAIKEVHTLLCRGYTKVVDADLAKYFDTIPHRDLMQSVARRVIDRNVLHLVKRWLKTPVEERDGDGRRRMTGGRRSTCGTPQGGVVSPPTILQKAVSARAGWIGCGECAVDAEHDIDVVLVDLDPLDQGADQVALHEPVDLAHAVADPFGEVLKPSDHE